MTIKNTSGSLSSSTASYSEPVYSLITYDSFELTFNTSIDVYILVSPT